MVCVFLGNFVYKRVWWKFTSWNWLLGSLPSYEFRSHACAGTFLDGRWAFLPHGPCMHGVLLSACFTGVVVRNGHRGRLSSDAGIQSHSARCFSPLPGLWTSGMRQNTGPRACLCFFLLPSTARVNPNPRRYLCMLVWAALGAALRKEARDREAVSRRGGDRVDFQSSSSPRSPPALVGTGQK